MKLFEDFIKNNSNEFDVFEPEVGHLERFENKLKVYDKSKKIQTGVGKEIIQIEKLTRDNPYQEKVIPRWKAEPRLRAPSQCGHKCVQ